MYLAMWRGGILDHVAGLDVGLWAARKNLSRAFDWLIAAIFDQFKNFLVRLKTPQFILRRNNFWAIQRGVRADSYVGSLGYLYDFTIYKLGCIYFDARKNWNNEFWVMRLFISIIRFYYGCHIN